LRWCGEEIGEGGDGREMGGEAGEGIQELGEGEAEVMGDLGGGVAVEEVGENGLVWVGEGLRS
jgi:hypothetical protein